MTKSPRRISTFCAVAQESRSWLEMGSPSEVLDPFVAGDIEEPAAPHHLAPGVLDAELAQAVAVDLARIEAVVHLLLIEDVAERIPMGRALHRHVDGVVGVADVGHHVLAAG